MTYHRDRHPLSGKSGVYVALFGDRVKVGRAKDLRARIKTHVLSGAEEIIAFPIPERWYATEMNALDACALIGRRIGQTESFADLPFEHAIAIVRACAGAATGTHSPAGIEVDMEALRNYVWPPRARSAS